MSVRAEARDSGADAPLFEAAPAPPQSAATEAAGRARRPRKWLMGLWLLLALATLWWGRRELERDVEASQITLIDPSRIRLLPRAAWADPRWEQELALSLSRFAPIRAQDGASAVQLVQKLYELSFVEAVRGPELIWPDGLSVELKLRQPVSCVLQERGFALVADDGTLLSNHWQSPPRVGPGWPMRLAGQPEDFRDLRPGQRLSRPQDLEAQALACALWSALDARDLTELGAIRIDAELAAQASVEEPGMRLYLEDGRLVLWGRSPLCTEPGELPLAYKLEALRFGLAALRSKAADRDWELLDVRWDRPEWRLRAAQAQPGVGQPGHLPQTRVAPRENVR